MAIIYDCQPRRCRVERVLDVVGDVFFIFCAIVPLLALILDALGVH